MGLSDITGNNIECDSGPSGGGRPFGQVAYSFLSLGCTCCCCCITGCPSTVVNGISASSSSASCNQVCAISIRLARFAPDDKVRAISKHCPAPILFRPGTRHELTPMARFLKSGHYTKIHRTFRKSQADDMFRSRRLGAQCLLNNLAEIALHVLTRARTSWAVRSVNFSSAVVWGRRNSGAR